MINRQKSTEASRKRVANFLFCNILRATPAFSGFCAEDSYPIFV